MNKESYIESVIRSLDKWRVNRAKKSATRTYGPPLDNTLLDQAIELLTEYKGLMK